MTRSTHVAPARFVLAAAFAVGIAGLHSGFPANATSMSTPKAPQERVLTAMMDDMKMGGMNRMGGGQMKDNSMGSGSGGMAGGSGGMGCCMGMMGQAPGSGMPMGTGMAMPSALPGFPGASHVYHVGGTGFFLDHADMIGLTVEQRTALNGIKQKALTEQSSTQRKIDEAEQVLWTLTAAEQPDAAAIEAKLREIEKLKTDQRLGFIRSVGEAAKALTADQRKMVLGMVSMPAMANPTTK